MKRLLAILLVLSCSFRYGLSSKSHPITTLLNAKWSITPVCLEVAEYLFDENPTLFWDYVEALNHLETPLHKIGKRIAAALWSTIKSKMFPSLQMVTQSCTNRRSKRPKSLSVPRTSRC